MTIFRRTRLTLPALLVFLALCLEGSAAATASTNPPAEPAFTDGLSKWAADHGATGLAVALRLDGHTTFYNFGEADTSRHLPVTSDSIFQLASITKVFATTLLALALDRGDLSLDDQTIRWLPELEEGGSDICKVTLRQLATHTSSLPKSPGSQPWHPLNLADTYTHDDFTRYLREWHASRPPGTHFEYSNIGIGLIGDILEASSKKTFTEMLETEVLRPLGMKSTGIELNPAQAGQLAHGYGSKDATEVPRTLFPAWPAAGALCSSARDMSHFLEANLGESDAPAPLLAAMHRTQQGEFKVSDTFTVGLAWNVFHADGATLIDKNGSFVGTSTYIGMDQEKHLGLVILVNRGKLPATTLGRKILLDLAGASLPTAAAKPAGGDPVQ